MAITNHERVGKSLSLLKAGLGPFVERELKAKYGDSWAFEAKYVLSDTRSERRQQRSHRGRGRHAGDHGSQMGRGLSPYPRQGRAQSGQRDHQCA